MRRSSPFHLALASLPACLLYALMVHGSTDYALAESVAVAARATGIALLLAFGVWRWTADMEWPHPFHARFIALHFLVAIAYGALWVLGVDVVESTLRGDHPLRDLAWGADLPLRVAVGAGIYAFVIGAVFAERQTQRLNAERARAAAAERELVEARLATLRSQIRPHFLFNALNTIAELMQEDVDAADGAIESLGRMLRQGLESPSDEVPLAEEWAFAERYLAFERLRYGDRLAVDVDLGPDVASLPVPAFSVQALVENAVRHGLSPDERGATITVSAERNGTSLRISVADDGAGPRPDWAERDGVGLGGLRRRLEALYGEDASLRAGGAPGRGFSVTLTLPVRAS